MKERFHAAIISKAPPREAFFADARRDDKSNAKCRFEV